jgi:hypothetical protein
MVDVHSSGWPGKAPQRRWACELKGKKEVLKLLLLRSTDSLLGTKIN